MALALAPLLAACAATQELTLDGWLFHRGDGDFAPPEYDDSSWRRVDVPHDFSAETLPPRAADASAPVIAVRAGTWRFREGEGDESWASPSFDDSAWRRVLAPNDWRTAYGYTAADAHGWFRRNVTVTAAQLASADVRLGLGDVASADVTYVNGERVGATGSMGARRGCKDELNYRSYGGGALASALRVGSNLVAVHVWSAGGPAGRWASRELDHVRGDLPAGDDVEPPRVTTLGEALRRCNATRPCAGITFESGEAAPRGKIRAYFKSTTAVGAASGWQSYVRRRAHPGGLVDADAPDGRSGPFDPAASAGGRQTGYTVGGVGWYRRRLELGEPGRGAEGGAEEGEALYLELEGCYMNCAVYLDGVRVGEPHPYGYTTYALRLPATASNRSVLAVRVANLGSNSRWYSGSGLYRPVRLLRYASVHLERLGGVYVTTPAVAPLGADGLRANATVRVSLTLVNDGRETSAPTRLYVEVWREGGGGGGGGGLARAAGVAPPIPPSGSATVNLTLPRLDGVLTWSPAQPALYAARVWVGDAADADDDDSDADTDADTDAPRAPDAVETFGFRAFEFSATRGLVLNGVELKLRGGCVHHAHGPLGSRAIPAAETRKVALLRASGYNAVRTAHNPPSRAFVDACDRLGLIVMEEAFDTWSGGKNPDDYHTAFKNWWRRDLGSMVLRDRSRPSILLWSIGNEVPIRHTPAGARDAALLAARVRSLDDGGGGSRRAVLSAYPTPPADDAADAFFAPLDIAGYNYASADFARDHGRVPSRVMVATETFPSSSAADWRAVLAAPYVIGAFVWTAIDYVGEASIGAAGHYTNSTHAALACGEYCAQPYSWVVSSCGDLDLVGGPRAQARLRRVIWNASKLELAVHAGVHAEVLGAWGFRDERQSWTWPDARAPLTVRAYAADGCISLYLNGRHLGAAKVSAASGYTAAFEAAYEPGELRAELRDPADCGARVGGARADPVASVAFRTSGPPARLRLSADRASLAASRDELSYVTAEVVDARGTLVECGDDAAARWCAAVNVSFALLAEIAEIAEVAEIAEIAAVGSGDPRDVSGFDVPWRRTYRGKATAVVRPARRGANGTVALVASAAGLASARIELAIGDGRAYDVSSGRVGYYSVY